MTDLPGKAIHDYYFQRSKRKLFVHDSFGPKVQMPVSLYFREYKNMPELERKALELCGGKILDIGAGAGSYTIELQKRGFDVTALEISPAASDVIIDRGAKKVVNADFFSYNEHSYDTLLLLMNGIGLCSTVDGFRKFLNHSEKLLAPKGRIIFDSCDISYMYEETEKPDHYYGEVKCCYEYGNEITNSFSWLYLDEETMKRVADEENWSAKIVAEDRNRQYLAVLKRK